jgi:hypothetical protein
MRELWLRVRDLCEKAVELGAASTVGMPTLSALVRKSLDEQRAILIRLEWAAEQAIEAAAWKAKGSGWGLLFGARAAAPRPLAGWAPPSTKL